MHVRMRMPVRFMSAASKCGTGLRPDHTVDDEMVLVLEPDDCVTRSWSEQAVVLDAENPLDASDSLAGGSSLKEVRSRNVCGDWCS